MLAGDCFRIHRKPGAVAVVEFACRVLRLPETKNCSQKQVGTNACVSHWQCPPVAKILAEAGAGTKPSMQITDLQPNTHPARDEKIATPASTKRLKYWVCAEVFPLARWLFCSALFRPWWRSAAVALSYMASRRR